MRVALFLLLIGSGVACAQETDERMAKILNPDKNATSTYSGKTFYGGGQFNVQAAEAKPFYLSNFFSARKFDAGTYQIGKYWTGEYYQAKSAATSGKYQIPNATKAVTLKDAPVKTAREATKTQTVQDYTGNRPYLITGKSQNALSQENAPEKPLTIDQLRDLLNKTR